MAFENRTTVLHIITLFSAFLIQLFAGCKIENTNREVIYADFGYKWVKVTDKADFAPRDGAGALVFKDTMWLIGGWDNSNRQNFPWICSNDVWNSKDGKSWYLVKENTFQSPFNPNEDWDGRHSGGYVVFKNKMWIIGGDAYLFYYDMDVWNSEDGRNWNWVNKGHPVPWGPRVLHYTVEFNGKIWVIGGQTLPDWAQADEKFYADVWNTEDGINWEKIIPNEPSWAPRGMIGGSAVFKGRIWVLGGGTYETPEHPIRKLYNDIWSSEDGINWICHTNSAPWEKRSYHDVAVYDNRLWVIGGNSDGQIRGIQNRNDVWFSEDGTEWIELPNTPWEPRHASSIFVHDGCLWVVAGNNMESDVWKLCKYEANN